MYNTRNNARWEQSSTNTTVLIVGKEISPEQLLAIPNTVSVILSFNDEIQKIGYKIFYVGTPIKATELIEKIYMAENASLKPEEVRGTPSLVDPIAHVSQKVRLLQWPKAEILKKNSDYPVLSTLLSKCAMTLKELAAISTKPEEVCHTFIAQIINNGDAEYVTATIVPSKTIERKPAPKRSLLDRIRISLGIFQK